LGWWIGTTFGRPCGDSLKHALKAIFFFGGAFLFSKNGNRRKGMGNSLEKKGLAT